jgi:predicted NUDIX family NTP pyrophosphohydrolase
MPETSAGVLLYRRTPAIEVFIGHMGGPFWARKDARAWSIPKGLYSADETPLAAAIREFQEETGVELPGYDYTELGQFRYTSGKRLTIFAAESSLAIDEITSNSFEIEWPPRSGRMREFPELDRAGWFTLDVAREKLVTAQAAAIDVLDQYLS